jgi:hypothetical protein
MSFYKPKTYASNLKSLDALPLANFTNEYYSLDKSDSLVEDFADKFSLARGASWFWGQTIGRFAELPLEKNENGLISAKKLVLSHIKPSKELTALWIFSRHPSRSKFVHKQTAEPDYCSLVPIIMSAFKKMHNIPYVAWDPSEIHGITDPSLVDAMLSPPLELTADELLEQREFALTVKSGKSAGSVRSALTTYMLYPPSGSALAALPNLARVMYCQTWCAHPSNRTKYMVLNPSNWDDMPQPLISEQIFSSPKNQTPTDLGADRWDF